VHSDETAVQCGAVRMRSLLLLGGAAGLLFVLAASVGNIHFAPGRPLDLNFARGQNDSNSADEGWLILALRVVLSLSIIGFPFVLIAVLLNRQSRRVLIAWIGVAAAILALRPRLKPHYRQRQVAPAPTPTTIASQARRVTEAVGPSPSVVALFASLLMAVALVAVVAWLVRSRRTVQPVARSDSLRASAADAADALRRGDDIEEVIQRCYVRMCEVLQADAGVERPLSMTPSEFQQRLDERNIPHAATLALTSLFERSRYGGLAASSTEQQQAIVSLDAIALACRTSRQALEGDRHELTA
jgi:Domain of unknown function (DUF4129)